jgi:hypothetical protein
MGTHCRMASLGGGPPNRAWAVAVVLQIVLVAAREYIDQQQPYPAIVIVPLTEVRAEPGTAALALLEETEASADDDDDGLPRVSLAPPPHIRGSHARGSASMASDASRDIIGLRNLQVHQH